MLTGIEEDEIIGNQIPDFDLLPLSITYYGGCGLEQAFEGNISALGLVLLNEPQNGVQYDDYHNNGKVAIFANGQRDGRGYQDNVDQRVLELVRKCSRTRFLALGESIWAVLTAPFFDFCSRQTIEDRC